MNYQLKTSSDGRLLLERSSETAIAVSVKRCFPWSEPLAWLSLRDDEGRELELVESAEALEPSSRAALMTALAEASFVFAVEKILTVVEEFELRTWRVLLQEGERIFQTRLNAWPRELAGGGLLIQDIGHDLYLIKDPEALDADSQRLLWAYVDD